jgi:F-type H+-transporting ATPase subunit c
MVGSVAALGAGLVAMGACIGIGIIGHSALQGIARQPEAERRIQVNMLIVAALVEGMGLFCAVICFLSVK